MKIGPPPALFMQRPKEGYRRGETVFLGLSCFLAALRQSGKPSAKGFASYNRRSPALQKGADVGESVAV